MVMHYYALLCTYSTALAVADSVLYIIGASSWQVHYRSKEERISQKLRSEFLVCVKNWTRFDWDTEIKVSQVHFDCIMSRKGKAVKRTFQEIEDSFIASYMEKYTALYEGDYLGYVWHNSEISSEKPQAMTVWFGATFWRLYYHYSIISASWGRACCSCIGMFASITWEPMYRRRM